MGRYNDRIRHGTQQTRLSNSTNFKGVKAALLFFPFFFSAQGTINPKWSGPWFAAILRKATLPSSLANGSFSTSNVRSERSFFVSVCNKTLEAVTTNIREQNLLGHILLENKELWTEVALLTFFYPLVLRLLLKHWTGYTKNIPRNGRQRVLPASLAKYTVAWPGKVLSNKTLNLWLLSTLIFISRHWKISTFHYLCAKDYLLFTETKNEYTEKWAVSNFKACLDF